MRAETRTVFYCDHCRKHLLTRVAMGRHEEGCTMNPRRVCRWRIDGHSDGTRVVDVSPVAAELASRASLVPSVDPEADERTMLVGADVEWLRDEVDGCPVCMLAALRQSGVDDYHYDAVSGERIFDYGGEVERLRVSERAKPVDVW